MSKRSEMFATDLRRAIAPVLRECPPECGVVSITEVEVSEDLGVVSVSISALRESKLALEFLKKRRPELKGKLAALELRRVPEIRFRIDSRSERGSRIEKLLEEELPSEEQ